MSALPKSGLQLVLENLEPFKKGMDVVNKKLEDNAKQTKEATKGASPLSGALDKVGISVDNIKEKIAKFTGINQEAIDGIFELAGSFGPLGLAIGAAVVGIAALGAAFVALGNRGAPLIGLADSFDRLTASVGVSSQALLVDLRKAAAGTVSDFDLIKRANLALVGTSGEFGKQFGKQLPQVLAAARAAAKATGQDVDFLFQSLVSGIKRASPRLIDNTGIVLKLGAANEELAKSLHKNVDQLTDEEKQIAVLNATVAAGNNLIASLGDNVETNSEKLARSQATITNIFDTFAVAVQPAFGTVLDIVNRVLDGFAKLATGLAPILGAVASIITDILGGAVSAILDILQPIFDGLTSFLPYISILFQGIANIIHGVVNAISGAVGGIVHFLQDVAKKFFGLDISNLGKSLFEGAAKAFGSFANGILFVANQLIFPAVIGIAKFIADFLIGFSPPKKGPLSQIDKGGENIMKAWLEGIAGVKLDPVEKVAAQVSEALGAIGKATLPEVNNRLAELDKALLPFQNRLDIVKSQFDAIAEPAKAALDAIDRQMQTAQEALANGDVNAADTIRKLDAARAAIQGQLDAQQMLVDQQQIQLGLATASQAQERALLNIRKAQLEAVKKTADVAQKAVAPGKEPKGAGGAAKTPAEAGAGGGIVGTPTGPSAIDLIGGQSAVNDAIGGIQDAFAGQIDTSQLDLFGQNSSALQDQLGRIGSVDIGSKLSDKFKGLTDLFDPNVDGSPAQAVSNFFSPDAKTPGSLASFVDSAGTTLSNLGPALQAAAPGISDQINAALSGIFDPEVKGSVAETITSLVGNLTGDENVKDSVASFFATMPQNVANAASGLFDQLQTNVFDPVKAFLTGSDPESLQGILNTAVTWFEALPGQVILALQGIGAAVYNAFAVPVISVINSLIDVIQSGIKGFITGVATFVENIAAGIDSANLGINTAGIHNIAADLNTKAGSINFGHISTALPAFLAPPAAERGGMFSQGLVKVGEKGPEYVGAASKIGVLPAELTRVLDGLGSILAAPAPMMVPGGDTYNNSSQEFNFHGVQSDNDARRRFNALRAGMR